MVQAVNKSALLLETCEDKLSMVNVDFTLLVFVIAGPGDRPKSGSDCNADDVMTSAVGMVTSADAGPDQAVLSLGAGKVLHFRDLLSEPTEGSFSHCDVLPLASTWFCDDATEGGLTAARPEHRTHTMTRNTKTKHPHAIGGACVQGSVNAKVTSKNRTFAMFTADSMNA